jgi:hypothetical protein
MMEGRRARDDKSWGAAAPVGMTSPGNEGKGWGTLCGSTNPGAGPEQSGRRERLT